MNRQLNATGLSPLGAAIVRGAGAKGMSLHEVGLLLEWPSTRIYDIIRAGSVRASWVSDLANLLDLDHKTLVALDARGGKR